jgi:hypothetical protein
MGEVVKISPLALSLFGTITFLGSSGRRTAVRTVPKCRVNFKNYKSSVQACKTSVGHRSEGKREGRGIRGEGSRSLNFLRYLASQVLARNIKTIQIM